MTLEVNAERSSPHQQSESGQDPIDYSPSLQTHDHHHHHQPQPDIDAGLAYWNSIARHDRSNNAVLGGFGHGSLPRVDAMSSRMLLLKIRPELSIIKSPHQVDRSSSGQQQGTNTQTIDLKTRRIYRALDVGAGIGRVTSDVLLYLFDRIDLVEPVQGFIETAKQNAIDGKWPQLSTSSSFNLKHLSIEKSVRFWSQSIQSFDPYQAVINPTSLIQPSNPPFIIGPQDHWDDSAGYDVIWAQWTLGHLTDEELVDFLKKSKLALRRRSDPVQGDNHDKLVEGQEDDDRISFHRNGGLIIVKENIYVDPSDPDGDNFLFDGEDSSVTRSHKCFLRIFERAGLNLIKLDVQRGFDPDLYKVHFYALQ